jgi:hypothetical protein
MRPRGRGVALSETVQVRSIDADVATTDIVAGVARLQRAARLVVEILRDHSWFMLLAFGYIALGMAIGRMYGETIRLSLYNNLTLQFCAWLLFFFLIGRIVWKLIQHRPEKPFRFLWDDMRLVVFNPRRILAAAPPFFLLPAAFSVVMSIKRMIPIIHPFNWDPTFAAVDKWLHGGVYPWELLQPIFGHPLVTVAIAEAYSFPWYALFLLMQFWYTFSSDPRRQQFLVSNLLIWILLGNGLAAAFASVGPCYYGHFVDGPDPFAAQMAYLTAVADSHRLVSVMAQEYLWTSYQSDFLRLGSGISAMPSMHLAIGTLMALWMWRGGRFFRIVGVAYVVLLLLGSVHLAWHYAIDGYVSILSTLLIWWVVGWALGKRPRKNPIWLAQ